MKPTAPFHVQAGRGIVDANDNVVIRVIAERCADGRDRYAGSSPLAITPVDADAFTREVCDILNRALAPKVRA